MNKLLTVTIILCMSIKLYGQINLSDSTVQVVGYWLNHEKQSFEVTHHKYKIQNTDTTSKETIKYEVDITIKDSTDKGYTIEWFYKNFSIQSANPLVNKISSLSQNMAVVIKTNPFGAIQEVSNWEEIRDNIEKMVKLLEKDLKAVPNSQQIIAQVMGMYSSKEAVEANAIKDAQQFYTFHGGKYKLGEKLNGQLQLMNNYGGKPFDAAVTVSLDEIDQEEGYSVIRMQQDVNSQQLTDVTYEYLKKLSPVSNQLPSRDKFPALTNQTWVTSQVHSGSGWIIYSVETKQVTSEGIMAVEEREIALK